jgi:hypothetical protein
MRLLWIKTKLLVLFVCLIFNKTKAQTELPLTYSPDGVVTSMIAKGDTLIVGGNFNHVGKYTGGGALFSNVSDQPDLSFPKINGSIICSTPDGVGGFYIFGYYYRESENSSQAFERIEHILANHTFEPGFSLPVSTNRINQLLFHHGILYVGATFDFSIGGVGQPSQRLAAIDVATKQPVPWIPHVTHTTGNGVVTRIFANGNSLYILGNFNSVGGVTRINAASIQIGTGTTKAWNPSPNWSAPGAYNDLLFYKNQIIIGGNFNDGGAPGNMKHACALVDTLTGQTFKYLFVSGGLFGNNGGYLYWAAHVNRLAIKEDILFASSSGTFDTRITAINLNTVNVSNPNISYSSGFLWTKYFNMSASTAAMTVVGNSLFVLGSSFQEVYLTNRPNGSPSDVERKIKGGVKLNTVTGALENWFPDPVNSGHILTMSASGSKILAGGNFTHVNGMDRRGVYMMNTQTETILPFKLNFTDVYLEIRALKLIDNDLYVGGLFGLLENNNYSVLGFNVNTGAVLNWYPPKLGIVETIEANSQFVFVGGNLTEPTGGMGRQNLFAINRTTGTLSNWTPNPSSTVKVLHLANGQLYVGGSFTTISGQTRKKAASYNVSALNLTSWNPDANGDVSSIHLKSGSIWLGGYFSAVGGVSRKLLAGVDPITGSVNINPNSSFYDWGGWTINTISSKTCKLFLGGSFDAPNTSLCTMLSVFDLSTNTIIPPNSFCIKFDGFNPVISSSTIIGNDLFFAGRFQKINNHTKSTSIGRVRFPANYFVPCTISNCGTAVALSSTVDDYNTGQYTQKTNLGISATNKVTGTSQVTLQSNSSILLLPNSNDGKGFTAKPNSGGYFKAQIGGCP